MTITKERLAEIKARCEAATEGPWFGEICHDANIGGWSATGPHHTDFGGGFMTFKLAALDASFISNARTDVPDLVAEVERLRGLLAGAQYYEVNDERMGWWRECHFCEMDNAHQHDKKCPAFTPEGEVK